MTDLQSIRNATGLSQAQFAALMGVPVRTLQNWEGTGKPHAPPNIINHAKLLTEHLKRKRGATKSHTGATKKSHGKNTSNAQSRETL